jgi:hypothetical protein
MGVLNKTSLDNAAQTGQHIGSLLVCLGRIKRTPWDMLQVQCSRRCWLARLLRMRGLSAERTSGGVTKLNPADIRYSQDSVSYLKIRPGQEPYTLNDITNSMSQHGWQGQPIDVIKMPEGGYSSLDNTRVLAARKAGIDIKANMRSYNDPLPETMARRFGHPQLSNVFAKTWGEALEYRLLRQNSSFINENFPVGTYEAPKIVYPKIRMN